MTQPPTPDDGGPAFPVVHAIVPQPGHYTYTPEARPGMSLRDYFAAKAMASILHGTQVSDESYWAEACRRVAVMSYRAADAMLAARGGGET